MNPFSVEWEPDAEDELARLWLLGPDPTAITTAQAQIDHLLSRNPTGNGQLLSEGLYRIEVPPLLANYTIDPASRTVSVSWVRLSS